jgi:lipid-binding SYLF domain-containing protein
MRTPSFVFGLTVLLLSGCAAPEGNTVAEKQAYAVRIRSEALNELYAREPAARSQVETAPGYVFISGFSVHPGVGTVANGYGIVQDNKTGAQRHIRLTRFAIGPGLAVKGYYAVLILGSEEALRSFDESQWYGGGFAEASFRFGDFGGSAAGEAGGGDHVESYLWTHRGVALELAAGGGTVYPEADLN